MSRNQLRSSFISLAIAGILLPILGVICLFLGPLMIFAPAFSYGGPVIAVCSIVIGLYIDLSTDWLRVTCPYCGQSFDVQPASDLITHHSCHQQLVVRGRKAYKLGEFPATQHDGRNEIVIEQAVPLTEQSVTCPLCGTEQFIPIDSDYCRCPNCHHEF